MYNWNLCKYLGFDWWKIISSKTETISKNELFSKIVSAIGSCGLRDSLQTVNVFSCSLNTSKIQQMLNEDNMSHVDVTKKDAKFPLII